MATIKTPWFAIFDLVAALAETDTDRLSTLTLQNQPPECAEALAAWCALRGHTYEETRCSALGIPDWINAETTDITNVYGFRITLISIRQVHPITPEAARYQTSEAW